VGRNEDKGQGVCEEIRRAAGHDQVEFLQADLSSMSQVNALGEKVRGTVDHLDVLLNNVGAFFKSREETAEGFERTFALNHLGYFLLTHTLLPLLYESAPARVINVASDAHRGVDVDFDNLQGEVTFSGWKAYQTSKLENVLFTYELAQHLAGSQVTANALHPGFVASRFGHNNGGATGLLIRGAQALFAINQEKGADTSVYLASSPEVEGVSGKYFEKCKEKASSPQSRNLEARLRLWRETRELLGDHLP
jgi:NAD(P)-dependent dehydrogenase (short-subunit alcohol dehydrogenase family)